MGWWVVLQNGLKELQVCKFHVHLRIAISLGIHCAPYVVQDTPDRFSGAGEALARRTGSGSGRNGEPTKHRTLLDSLMSSKAVRSRCIILKLQSIPSVITKSLLSCNAFCRPLIQIKQGRHHCRGTGARQDGLLFRRANQCGDPSDTNRTSRLFSSSSSRPSAAQRALQSAGAELRSSSLSKTRKSSRDDPTIRSFEMLSLSADRRK